MKERAPSSLKVINNEPSGGDVVLESPGRRNFLKVLGAGSAAGLAGCADSARQNIFPLVQGDKESIPGVAVWYSSTCTECSAGCGIQVRTREGRAVKIEGNPDNPINRGGLCGLGQSALQHLYDPDRIRQPLKKDKSGKFQPVSWQEAYKVVGSALKDSGDRRVFLTGAMSGSELRLSEEFAASNQFELLQYDPLAPVALSKASEVIFGSPGIPHFNFEKADALLNFGADFLETWLSPVEFARSWADARRGKEPLRVIHIEPRLSLTAANADEWLKIRPSSELVVAKFILSRLLRSHSGGLDSDAREFFGDLARGASLNKAASLSGISVEKVLLLVEFLESAKSPLVLPGRVQSNEESSLQLALVTLAINTVLGGVGKTISLGAKKTLASSADKLDSAVKEMEKGKVDVAFIHGANPLFTLPAAKGFEFAFKKVGFKVALSSHLDETTLQCDIVLPPHTSLESWGDVVASDGMYGLKQPVMTPVFDTEQYGDILIRVSEGAGVAIGPKEIGSGETPFFAYLKGQWREIHSRVGRASQTFNDFWKSSVEQGGYYADYNPKQSGRVGVRVQVSAARELLRNVASQSGHGDKNSSSHNDELILYPYASVKAFDGSAANRPWMQELPDPVTQVVWDSWAELHPDTAKKHGFKHGDYISVNNKNGQLNLPVYVTKHVHPEIVAVPLGQGHTAYGRYAKEVSSVGNTFSLLPAAALSALATVPVQLKAARGKHKMVVTQGHDSQEGRELARRKVVGSAEAEGHSGHHDSHGGGHGGHHEPQQMYEQRKHPLYSWGLAVDLASCTGCSACVVACYAENNIPTVGKEVAWQGREMSWLRIERYFDEGGEHGGEEFRVSFLPMMCQHCNNAPCEPVCPVYATYHSEEGLNAMVYNRCVGTRYCGNNCSYKVRRYNWFEFNWPEPLNWQLNPDVTKRTAGVMEKCSFCVQRINEGKDHAKDEGRLVRDGEIQPACVQSCPTKALAFGDLNDPNSTVSKWSKTERSYKVLDHHLNTQPSVTYLEDVKYEI